MARALAGCIVYLGCLAAVGASTSDEALLPLLSGEFALQEGATAEAAVHYIDAAEASTDPRLAERAARLAMLAGDLKLAERGLRQWRRLQPAATGLPPLELSLALAKADAAAARAALDRVLQRPDGWKSALPAIAAEPKSLIARSLVMDLVQRESLWPQLDAMLAVGSLADRLELPGLSIQVAELLQQHHPDTARAWLWQADSARKREDDASARASIERALALPDMPSELRMAAAGLLSSLGDPAAAAEALAGGEQTHATRAGRAAFLARAEDQVGLTALYDELRALPAPVDEAATAERYYLLGQLAELLERVDEAAQWYRQVPSGEQGDLAELRLAVLAETAGDLDAALAALQALQSSDSDNGRLLIDAFLLEAELLVKHDRLDDAVDAYDRGLAVFEDEAALLYARALLFERMDRIDAAEADLRRMLALDPDNPDALNALGYTLADRTERLDEAHDLIRRALNQQPDNPAIIDSMGWVLFRMGRAEEALPHLRRAFELQRDAEVAAHLGEALWAVGKRDEARSIWRLGTEIDPENRAMLRVHERYLVQP